MSYRNIYTHSVNLVIKLSNVQQEATSLWLVCVHILNILRNLGPLGLDTMVSDHGTSVDILDGVPPVLKPVTSTK